jgi:long-chain acyl-CoA synthetase
LPRPGNACTTRTTIVNLADALANHARNRPTHPAVIDGERVVGHAEFHAAVASGAARLHALGLRAGDFVGLLLSDTPEHLMALYALLRAGMVAVPMNRRWSAHEQAAAARTLSVAAVAAEADLPHLAGTRMITIDRTFFAGAGDADRAAGDDGDRPALLVTSSGTTSTPKSVLFTHTSSSGSASPSTASSTGPAQATAS